MITRITQLDFADLWTFVVFPLFPLACWIIYLYGTWKRRQVLSLEQRKEVPWGAIDVVLILGSMLFAKFLGQLCAIQWISWKTGLDWSEVNQQVALENANILVGTGIFFSVLQMVFAVFYLKKAQGSTWADLGFDIAKIKRQIGAGLVASIMIIPLVVVVNVLIHVLLKVEYSHQVMTMVRYSLLITAVSTVLVAPIVEEFHFRVVLQGFLQRITKLDLDKKVRIIQGDVRAKKLLDADSKSRNSKRRDELFNKSREVTRPPWWPILISSLMFASVHAGQGAAPYALFALAMMLGFLYRQTNSIVPCILVHLFLNLWSFVALIYSLD